VLTDCNHPGKLHFWPPRLYHLRKLAIWNSYLTFPAFHSLLICSNPINREEVMIIGTPFTSGGTLITDSDLDWRWSRKTLLTEHSAVSGKMHNRKVIDNFQTFRESINTSSSGQRFRSCGHCKLGCCWTQFWTDCSVPSNLNFGSDAKWNIRYFQNQTCRWLAQLSKAYLRAPIWWPEQRLRPSEDSGRCEF
jgi:hypothetical protein